MVVDGHGLRHLVSSISGRICSREGLSWYYDLAWSSLAKTPVSFVDGLMKGKRNGAIDFYVFLPHLSTFKTLICPRKKNNQRRHSQIAYSNHGKTCFIVCCLFLFDLFCFVFYPFSRGAELINRILIKAVLDEKEKEKSILRKIKKNMDRIKQQQAKMTERVVEPTDHYEGR